jgi:hypothetical protein
MFKIIMNIYIFQTSFFAIKCAPFFFTIRENLNIDN